jgi:PII-like signaling protein
VNADCLKLTTYFGERDRSGDRFLAEALLDVYGRRELQTSVLLRGTEGFGVKHHLQTERLLTLSEDLPLVTAAVDERERIEAALPEVTELMGDGLVSLERARMLTGRFAAPELHGETKLTVYCGRQERLDGRPAFVAIVDLLRRHGVAGATVLLGVDGTFHGVRERARFFGRNAGVPLMIIAVGAGEALAAAAAELGERLARPLLTVERVRVLKRDGELLATPPAPAEPDVWQKLMVYGREPLHLDLIHALRTAGAGGATALRGIWGYHGDHEPHGDRLFALRRRAPVVTVIVDTPERARRWFDVVNGVTAAAGLVTCEMVPAARASGPDVVLGALRLAD